MIYDVLIIGGGITGAGILRDCALRGLKAILLDKDLPGRATTAASTHLIHGGLRYLLYDRLTTHATSWDAGNIVRIARPMLTRLPILWPVYSDHRHGIETVETLLKSYDYFQRMKEGRPHVRLKAETAADLFPGLRTEGLIGAVAFDEWWVDAVGLTEKNIRAAENYGAQIRTGTRVKGLMRKDGNTVCGVAAVSESGSTSEFSAKIVINASGPWVDEISKMAGVRTDLRLRKGTHLVYDRRLVEHGLLLEAADRERYIFVVPFKNGTLVGPTDLSSAGTADELKADESEIRYLLDSVKRYLPDFPEDYASTRTGARPILGQTGSEKLLSREYEIHDHAEDGVEGFLTIAGGKMSDFRLMAKDAVDLACRKIDSKKKCETHCLTLSGERLENIPAFARPGKRLKRFMRKNPRLRELYSLAWLGAGLIRHTLSRIFFGTREISADQFRKHYATGEKV